MIKQVKTPLPPARKHQPRQKDILEFVESGWDAAEVVLQPGEIIRYVQNSYVIAARRLHIKIRTTIRDGKLYLLKWDPEEGGGDHGA